MWRLGFKRIRYDDYIHPEEIRVEDLHDENVFIDEEHNLVVIDLVIYLEGTKPANKVRSSPMSSGHPARRSLLPGA